MNSQKNLSNVIAVSIALSLLYAILRYNIFNNVPWEDLPVYVLNKALSLTIILLLFYDQYMKTDKEFKNNLWFAIIILAILHLLLSLSILVPSYFEKFYVMNQLNIIGSLSIFFGVLAFSGFLVRGIFWLKNMLNSPFSVKGSFLQGIKLINILFIAAHLFIMDFQVWKVPAAWPGFLPPVSLIAFVLLSAALFKFIRDGRSAAGGK